MDVENLTESKRRVLAVAERHFMRHGFAAVTLQDIADELDIKQASLYYHAPGGKQDLFEQLVRHAQVRHARGIEDAITRADASTPAQVESILEWLVSQPPLPVTRLLRSDLTHLDETNQVELERLTRHAVLAPVGRVFLNGVERGELRECDPTLAARILFDLVFGTVDTAAENGEDVRLSKARELVDMLFNGLLTKRTIPESRRS